MQRCSAAGAAEVGGHIGAVAVAGVHVHMCTWQRTTEEVRAMHDAGAGREVHMCMRMRKCRGAVVVQRWSRGSAEVVQRSEVVQRCTGVECRGAIMVVQMWCKVV